MLGIVTESAVGPSREALAGMRAFEIVLARFDAFRHRGGAFTLWLAPEPKDVLVRRFPERDAVNRFGRGFTPHLSVGQARGEDELRAFRRDLDGWKPLAFGVRSVTIIVRGPPDDVFRPLAEVALA